MRKFDNDQSEKTDHALSKLRSRSSFNFKDDCLFCGQKILKKTCTRGKFHVVQTLDIKKSFLAACQKRNDGWAHSVEGRVAFVSDLHAADTLCHQQCSTNFRSFRGIPKKFATDADCRMETATVRCRPEFYDVKRWLRSKKTNSSL